MGTPYPMGVLVFHGVAFTLLWIGRGNFFTPWGYPLNHRGTHYIMRVYITTWNVFPYPTMGSTYQIGEKVPFSPLEKNRWYPLPHWVGYALLHGGGTLPHKVRYTLLHSGNILPHEVGYTLLYGGGTLSHGVGYTLLYGGGTLPHGVEHTVLYGKGTFPHEMGVIPNKGAKKRVPALLFKLLWSKIRITQTCSLPISLN